MEGSDRIEDIFCSEKTDEEIQSSLKLMVKNLHLNRENFRLIDEWAIEDESVIDDILILAIENTNINLAKHVVSKFAERIEGGRLSELALGFRRKSGYLEILKIKYINSESGILRDQKLMNIAAYHGHLRIVKYLVEKNCLCYPSAVCNAVLGENLPIVKFLIEAGKPCTKKAVNLAAKHGYLQILQLLIEKGIPCTSKTMEAAAREGNLDVVRYLVEIGCPYTLKTVEAALEKGYRSAAEYLKEHYRQPELKSKYEKF